MRDLIARGATCVISLLDEREQSPRYDLTMLDELERVVIPIKDFSAPSREQIRSFMAALERQPHSLLVVHCQGGSGRTGTMAAAYWIRKGLSARDAVTKVRQANPHAVETREQWAALLDYAESLNDP